MDARRRRPVEAIAGAPLGASRRTTRTERVSYTLGEGELMVRRSASGAGSAKRLRRRVAEVLDTLRPMAQRDGGDIELISVDPDGVVRVRLHGACIGCPSSALTLTMGIERNLKDRIPEVKRVVCEP